MTAQIESPVLVDDYTSSEETKKMATGVHSGIALIVTSNLAVHVRKNRLGWVLESSATYDFKDNLPKRQPDGSFVNRAKMDTLPDADITAVPDLVLEVVSKIDTVYEVQQKVMQYQAAGVPLIWIIDPFSKVVLIYRLPTGLKSQSADVSDVLGDENLLPGFSLPVKDIFDLSL